MRRGEAESLPFFPELLVRRETPLRFGDQIKVSGYLVSNIEGNPYILRPVSSHEALKFLHDPSLIPSRKKFIQDSPPQPETFPDLELDSIDLPSELYPILSGANVSQDNIEQELARAGMKDSMHLKLAREYFGKLPPIGPCTELSNSSFVAQLSSLSSKYHLEGERYSSVITISGRFDEVRKSEDRETIVRIRQKAGNPSSTDAIKLVLDCYGYMAANKRKGYIPPFPILKVFNLTDGKMWRWNILPRVEYDMEQRRKVVKYPYIFREVVNAITLSSLALKAGYLDEEEPKTIDPGFFKDHAKKIHIKKAGQGEVVLTAEEAIKKAQYCLKRIKGEAVRSQRMFNFVEEPNQIPVGRQMTRV